MFHESRFRRIYYTDRLILKILEDSYVDEVLSFLNKGAHIFDTYESKKPSDFYTHSMQKKLLRAEFLMANQKNGVRFWIYHKDNPHEIIGTISYSFYKTAPFNSIMVGYKLLPEFWNCGYGTEAVKASIHIVSSVMKVNRIEAFVLPENKASQALLNHIGFRLEGTAYACLEVQGVRRDHLQFSLSMSE